MTESLLKPTLYLSGR